MVLVFTTAVAESPASQRYDIIKRNITLSIIEIVNDLELVVHAASDKCHVFPSKLENALKCSCELTVVSQFRNWKSRLVSSSGCSEPEKTHAKVLTIQEGMYYITRE